MKVRKKPIEVEAMQFTNESKDQVFNFIRCNCYADFDSDHRPVIIIQTLEGEMKASLGDWVIKGVNGEFYPCKPDIFDVTYDILDGKEKPNYAQMVEDDKAELEDA